MEEIKFINDKLKGRQTDIPRFLYKYRPFDRYTYDMLDNNYFYLCPAKNLDDPSECTVSFDMKDYYDTVTDGLKFRCVEQILENIRPHTTNDNFEMVKTIIFNTMLPNGEVRRNYLLDMSFELQKYVPYQDSIDLVNWIGNIPERLDEPDIKNQFMNLITAAYDARECMGICSLSSLKNCQEMWDNYTVNDSGYCVEYNMEKYENENSIFPVLYQDIRDNNILSTIMGNFISQMIFGISGGQIDGDRSQYISMFLTKETKWAYQKEWRIIGDANQKISAANINAIYLGKNLAKEDREKMQNYCMKHNIPLINR